MFILRRADHQHFLDDDEGEHEAHRDATLRGLEAADQFLAGDVEVALAAHGVDAIAYRLQEP